MSQISNYSTGGVIPPGTYVETLTGNTGGAVGPNGSGNINVIGAGVISVAGNPGTNTLTITGSGIIASSFPTDSGTATPVAGVLIIKADTANTTCGSSVSFSAPGPSNIVELNVTDSDNNTLIGLDAGNLTLTGQFNVGLGQNALNSLTSGIANTAIGTLSCDALQTGTGNVGVGENTLQSNVSASANTAVGTVSLLNLTGGSGNNIALGTGALNNLDTGSGNIAISSSLVGALTGSESNNLLIAHPGIVGYSNLVAISIPNGATYTHNYGTGNTFLGELAGNTTLTVVNAISNVGVGYNSLNALTTGDSNVMVGEVSGVLLQTGSNNVGVGISALSGIITGTDNVALGTAAGSNYNNAESNNVCIANDGVVADAATIRIGTNAVQTAAYVAGIDGVNVGSTAKVVTMGTAGTADKLGTATITAGSGITITPGANTITISAATTVAGTGTTVGAVTADIITVALGATPSVYTFGSSVAAFESATPSGAGYELFSTLRTTGAAASLVGSVDQVVNEEAALLTADATWVASGNNAILRVTGVAGLTINWSAYVSYTIAS